jgi:hypothetical protein
MALQPPTPHILTVCVPQSHGSRMQRSLRETAIVDQKGLVVFVPFMAFCEFVISRRALAPGLQR